MGFTVNSQLGTREKIELIKERYEGVLVEEEEEVSVARERQFSLLPVVLSIHYLREVLSLVLCEGRMCCELGTLTHTKVPSHCHANTISRIPFFNV